MTEQYSEPVSQQCPGGNGNDGTCRHSSYPGNCHNHVDLPPMQVSKTVCFIGRPLDTVMEELRTSLAAAEAQVTQMGKGLTDLKAQIRLRTNEKTAAVEAQGACLLARLDKANEIASTAESKWRELNIANDKLRRAIKERAMQDALGIDELIRRKEWMSLLQFMLFLGKSDRLIRDPDCYHWFLREAADVGALEYREGVEVHAVKVNDVSQVMDLLRSAEGRWRLKISPSEAA